MTKTAIVLAIFLMSVFTLSLIKAFFKSAFDIGVGRGHCAPGSWQNALEGRSVMAPKSEEPLSVKLLRALARGLRKVHRVHLKTWKKVFRYDPADRSIQGYGRLLGAHAVCFVVYLALVMGIFAGL